MGKGSKGGWNDADHASLPVYTWKEVEEHKERDDRWIVINNYVYDVTSWAKRHPGGEKIIGGHAGHDASVSVDSLLYQDHWEFGLLQILVGIPRNFVEIQIFGFLQAFFIQKRV